MSVTTSYPGIYIQELNSSSHAIVPAPTSIAAFVGYSHPFQTQAFNTAQLCFSFNDYQTYFGPLFSSGLIDASLPRAVYQFFLNGGSTAWVVGLQPGLFGPDNEIINRLGAANGGEIITATVQTTSSAAGGGVSANSAFAINTVYPTPAITGISPQTATAGSAAFTLTVTGTGFSPNSVVLWGGAPLESSFISSTQLTAQVPATALATGTPAVTVNTPVTAPATGGGGSNSETFTVNGDNSTPSITSLLPAKGIAGQGFSLTVLGSDFVPGCTVEWQILPDAAVEFATSFISDTELVATIPASAAVADTFSVTVVNPAPGGGASAATSYTVSATYPAPGIPTFSPSSMTLGDPGFTLTVSGADFYPGSVVNFGGAPLATSFVNPGQLTAEVPASAIATAGTPGISVTNPAPGGTTAAAVTNFTIAASNPTPDITTLDPASAVAGGATFTLRVTGTGFVPSSVVAWNGLPLTTTYVSDTELQALVPASSIAGSGSATVTVVTATGAGLVFTAQELTDIQPMTVTISNVRNAGGTFDAVVTYGTRVETYRGLQLAGPNLPDKAINKISALVQVAPSLGGYGTAITAQQISLSLDIPANLVTCFSSSDFVEGDEANIAVFEANSSLDNLEIFNLLIIPGVTDFSILSAGLAFAERKKAFMIQDAPLQSPAFGSAIANPQPVQNWMTGLGGAGGPMLPLSQNGAIYFPFLVSNDPVTTNNIPIAPSGFVAGIFAQTDNTRGVWKAPAGLATTVLNTSGPVLQGAMNDPQQGVLNLDSINCLRSFSGSGTVVWGSRTLVAANTAYQQSMYIPVRRMTLFIEQTLLANLRWVVFEPNDEPLWIAIVRSISAFMLSLFRQGALQGSTPSDAFQVKCDSTTTTPADQATGIVNIVVAFAPLKPAEFVIVQIAQLAGQTGS